MTAPRRVTRQASVVLAPNPGPMTLDGTNSYLLRDSGPAVVVDPGPSATEHLAALAAAGPIALILITHQHPDHTEGAAALREMTGAPVRAPSAADCLGGEVPGGAASGGEVPGGAASGGGVLVDGERITVGGLVIEVMATPGHTADSVSFHLPNDGPLGTSSSPMTNLAAAEAGTSSGAVGSVLTGDTVLGRGSTVIGIPDGTLVQYLASLRRLADLGRCIGLPAHGPMLPDLAATCTGYLEHRLARLEQVREVVAGLGAGVDLTAEETVQTVFRAVYGDVDPSVAFAAAYSVATQLAYLRDERSGLL